MSNNGPQFGSAEFRVFSREQQFYHVTSRPFYPDSNGFVERSVQTVKNSFVKAIEGGRSLQAAVRAIRSTSVGWPFVEVCSLCLQHSSNRMSAVVVM